MNLLRTLTPVRSVSRSRRLGLLSLGAAAILLAVGCSGVPAPTACYIATGSTVRAVDLGMSVAGDLYRAGKLSEEQKGKLVAAHDVYRPVAKAAIDGCKVAQNQGDVEKQVSLIRDAADHVIEALTKAGVLK